MSTSNGNGSTAARLAVRGNPSDAELAALLGALVRTGGERPVSGVARWRQARRAALRDAAHPAPRAGEPVARR